ncbi:hypothetical protein OROGR_032245 [Orobanche gracilis]
MDRPWLHQVDGICVLCAGVFPLLCVWLGFVGLILSGMRVCCGRLGGGEERNERRFGQRRRDPHSLTFQGIGLVRGIIAHRWPAHSLSGLAVRRIWRIAW